MTKKKTGICILTFVEERKKEHDKEEHMRFLKEIIDRNYIFTDHYFSESEIEIIRKK